MSKFTMSKFQLIFNRLWHKNKPLIALGLTTTLLLAGSLLVFLNRHGVWQPFWRRASLTAIQHEKGFAYTATTHHPELSSHLEPSDAQVLENGLPLAGPANTLHARIRQTGGGQYSFWHSKVYFSTSDNSDPCVNGRRYEILYPYNTGSALAWSMYGAAALAMGLMGIWFGCSNKHALREILVNLRNRLKERGKRMLLPCAVASVMPVYLLMTLPPTFNNTDAACYFSWNLRALIPHYKPGYLIFVRTINNLLAGNWLDPAAPSNVSTLAVYVIIIIQHLVAIIAIGYFASVVSRSLIGRVFVAATLSLFPAVSAYNHGIFQEALMSTLVILLGGITLVACHRKALDKTAGAVAGTVLFLALLIRHDALFLLLVLPTPLLILMIFSKKHRDYQRAFLFAVSLSGLALAASFLALLLVNIHLRTLGRPSAYGQECMYSIKETVDQEDKQDIQRLITRMQADTIDPLIRQAIEPIFSCRHPWVEHFQKAREIIERNNPRLDEDTMKIRTDEMLNAISILYLKHGFGFYLGNVYRHFTGHLKQKPLNDLRYVRLGSFDLINAQKNYKALQAMTLFNDPGIKARYKSLDQGWWVSLFLIWPRYWVFIPIGFLLLAASLVHRDSQTSQLGWACSFLLLGILEVLFMSVLRASVPRFHNVGMTMLLLAFIALITNIGQTVKPSRPAIQAHNDPHAVPDGSRKENQTNSL